MGDYLHAMYAMRNAALHALGVTSKPVAPHRLSLQEAATNTNAVFSIHPPNVYGTITPVTPPSVWFGASTTAAPLASTSGPGSHAAIWSGATARDATTTPTARAVKLNYCHIHWN